MNRKQFGEMLAQMQAAIKANKDPQEVLDLYYKKYKYAYVYNDAIAKSIFGSEVREKLTIDLLNAILKLEGDNRIKKLQFSRTERGAELGVKHVNSDIVADWDGDRIVLEFQHEGDSNFKDRLVYYMARDTIPMLRTGEKYHLKSLYTISVQLFNEPIYGKDKNYLHSILLKDENGQVYYEKQVLKLVEVMKFLRYDNSEDSCRLAQWLRAIDSINNEEERSFDDPVFAALQKSAELCNFDALYFCTEAKMALDYEYEMAIQLKREVAEQVAEELPKRVAEQVEKQVAEQVEKQVAERVEKQVAERVEKQVAEERKRLRAQQNRELVERNLRAGCSVEMIANFMDMPVSEVLEIQKELAI